jgi:ParB-like chromosome segregation protein Spo0J
MVRDGRLSSGHARAILTAPDPRGLAQRAISEGLNVRDIERLAQAKDEKHGPRVTPGGSSAEARALTRARWSNRSRTRSASKSRSTTRTARGISEDLLQVARATRRRDPPSARRLLSRDGRLSGGFEALADGLGGLRVHDVRLRA